MLAEVNNHLKDYLNQVLIEGGLVLNEREGLLMSSLVVINKADCVMWNDLHNA